MAVEQGWSWPYGMLWREGSSARCKLLIAETVLFSEGKPRIWLFTAQVSACDPTIASPTAG